MKKLPIGIQTFEKIRQGNYLYVDKTQHLPALVSKDTYYFFARPRRFGKSLLLSTLKAYFEGREDLFRGLDLHSLEKEWTSYPVIYLDYGTIDYNAGTARFEASLLFNLELIAQQYGVSIKMTSEVNSVADSFKKLVIALHNKLGKVVVLVDEYDKPLVDTLLEAEKYEENRKVLNKLYSSMKGLDTYFRFVFLTGVSRFAKVGIFSGMNNPDDLSTNKNFNELLGFSQKELEENFGDYLDKLDQKFNLGRQRLLQAIKEWYNGFSWDGIHKLYNPFSILNLFNQQTFGNYWFSTGTPTFLIDLIKQQKQLPNELEGIIISDLTGSSLNYRKLPLLPILFQTGYLTVEKVIQEGFEEYYQLNYPNKEVRDSFITFVLAGFLEKDEFEIQPEAVLLRNALKTENTTQFLNLLKSFLADIPGRLHLPKEAYYHSLVYLLLRLVGLRMSLEKETNKGRIDGVIEFFDKVYILEFKFATNKRLKNIKTLSQQALKQIDDKQYFEPWLGSGKKIILLGIGFLNKDVHGKVKIFP